MSEATAPVATVRVKKAKQIVDRSKRAVKLAGGKAKKLLIKPRDPKVREKVNVGKKLGLNVGQTWVFLLLRNERESSKMTDAVMRAFMRAEFPANATSYDYAVSLDRLRAKYNAGGFDTSYKQPTSLSVEYDSNGKSVTEPPKKRTAEDAAQSPWSYVVKHYQEILKDFKAKKVA